MVIEKQFINAERFLELVEQPQYEDRIVELVEGELVEMSKASGKHGQITMRLAVHNRQSRLCQPARRGDSCRDWLRA